MADLGGTATFQNHGPVTNQAARDIHITQSQGIDSRDNECLRDLHVINPETHKRDIERRSGGILKDSYCWILDNSEFRRFRNDPQSRLLWVKGDPGKGKTMLLCGIIDELQQESSQVISYFFCQATELQLRSATSVIRGLIWFLCKLHPELTSCVRARYDSEGKQLFENSCAFSSLQEILADVLEKPPLQGAILIVDALDECSDDGRDDLIELIVKFSSASRTKWVVSSRNWTTIEEQFRAAEKVKISLELNKDSVSQAVQAFISYNVNELAQIKKYSQAIRKTVYETLLRKANDTFLWVALVCKELAHPRVKLRHTIAKLDSLPERLTQLYGRMLTQITKSDDANICREILATACAVFRPVTLDELQVLIPDLKNLCQEQELKDIISDCGSFLTHQEGALYFVHQSARDFLVENEIDVPAQHGVIFRRSLNALKALKRNIYNLQSPGILVEEVKLPNPDPFHCLQYCSLYWANHLEQTRQLRDPSDDETLNMFLRQKSLYWLEFLSLQGRIPEGVEAILKLRPIIQNTVIPELKDLVEDMRRFILYHRAQIEVAPLQLYASALIFSPTRSLVRELFEGDKPDWITLKSTMRPDWGTCIQTRESFMIYPYTLALSPNGERLAIVSRDTGFQVFDTASSHCIRSFQTVFEATAIEFSADGRQVAMALTDGRLELWDVDSGEFNQRLQGHGHPVQAISFWSDQESFVSVSLDGTVHIWNLPTGNCIRTFHTHTLGKHGKAKFSKDSRRLVTCLGGDTATKIHIWNIENGTQMCQLETEGTFWSSASVTFLSDGSLALAFTDRVVIWDPEQGTCAPILELHSGEPIVSLGRGRWLASCHRNDIKVYNDMGECVNTLKGHNHPPDLLAFCAEKQLLLSVDDSECMKLWELNSNLAVQQTTESHGGAVSQVRFATAGSQLISATKAGSLKIWDTSTGDCSQTFQFRDQETDSLVLAPSEQHLLYLPSDDSWLLDIREGKSMKLAGHVNQRVFEAAKFSPDSHLFGLHSMDGKVKIYDIAKQDLRCVHHEVVAWTFTADSQHIILLSAESVGKWDISSGNCVRKFGTTQFPEISMRHLYPSIAVSQDSHWLAVVYRTLFCISSRKPPFRPMVIGVSETIFVMDLSNGALLHKLKPIRSTQWAALRPFFSSDNKWLAVTSGKNIQIWDAKGGTPTYFINMDFGTKIERLHHRFDSNNSARLFTNFGILDLENHPVIPKDPTVALPLAQRLSYCGYGVDGDGKWILNGSERVLLVPLEYRKAMSVMGSNIAFGSVSGEVLLVQLSLEWAPR